MARAARFIPRSPPLRDDALRKSSKDGTPSGPGATASPSIMQVRHLSRLTASATSGKREVQLLPRLVSSSTPARSRGADPNDAPDTEAPAVNRTTGSLPRTLGGFEGSKVAGHLSN
jgi:hypothetical protein